MDSRQPAPQLLGNSLLVRRVAEREQQADGNGLRVHVRKRRQIERHEHALRPDSLPDAVTAIERDERRGQLVAEPVEVGPGLPP